MISQREGRMIWRLDGRRVSKNQLGTRLLASYGGPTYLMVLQWLSQAVYVTGGVPHECQTLAGHLRCDQQTNERGQHPLTETWNDEAVDLPCPYLPGDQDGRPYPDPWKHLPDGHIIPPYTASTLSPHNLIP